MVLAVVAGLTFKIFHHRSLAASLSLSFFLFLFLSLPPSAKCWLFLAIALVAVGSTLHGLDSNIHNAPVSLDREALFLAWINRTCSLVVALS